MSLGGQRRAAGAGAGGAAAPRRSPPAALPLAAPHPTRREGRERRRAVIELKVERRGEKRRAPGPPASPRPRAPALRREGAARCGRGRAAPRLTAPRFSPHSTPVLWCTPLLLSASRPSSAPRFSCQHSSSLVHRGSPLSILVLLVHPTSPVSTPVLLLHPAFLVHFGSPGAPQFT